jgi:DNA-binding transcriptional LysR family regulator
VLHHLRPDRVNPDNVIECNSIPAIRSLVAAGMGAGVLARWTISDELARGTLVALPMGPRRLFRSWVALSLRIKRLSLPQVQLIDLIRTKAMERFPDLLKSPGPAPAPAPAAEPAPDLPVLAADDSL